MGQMYYRNEVSMTDQLPRRLRWLPHPSRRTWQEFAWIRDIFHPDGVWADVTPRPGCRYTAATWPPRHRGRGESMTSPRRCDAFLRAAEAIHLRCHEQLTWAEIAARLGFRDKSGAWRAAPRH